MPMSSSEFRIANWFVVWKVEWQYLFDFVCNHPLEAYHDDDDDDDDDDGDGDGDGDDGDMWWQPQTGGISEMNHHTITSVLNTCCYAYQAQLSTGVWLEVGKTVICFSASWAFVDVVFPHSHLALFCWGSIKAWIWSHLSSSISIRIC